MENENMTETAAQTTEPDTAEKHGSDVIRFDFPPATEQRKQPKTHASYKMPTLGQLLDDDFPERQHLLFPWLREQESCMVYSATGVGKSMFALSAAIAIAGGGTLFDWKPHERSDGCGWKVAYVDGEMHIGDIQERARLLLAALPGVDHALARKNLRFLPRQHQEPGTKFPLITDLTGTEVIRSWIQRSALDLVILDNFSTLGVVEDENAASSFNAIQEFLLTLKTQGVATILVHHANKTGEDFRGSSKLAATFETIIKLEPLREDAEPGTAQFRVRWDKVRAGGPDKTVREVVAKLTHQEPEQFGGPERVTWDYETGLLTLIDDLKIRLQDGELINQKEIADFYGKTKPMGRQYIDKGIRLGVWTEDEVSRWFAKGQKARNLKRTEPPVPPSTHWKTEVLDEEPDEPAEF
jgi:AAA domain